MTNSNRNETYIKHGAKRDLIQYFKMFIIYMPMYENDILNDIYNNLYLLVFNLYYFLEWVSSSRDSTIFSS